MQPLHDNVVDIAHRSKQEAVDRAVAQVQLSEAYDQFLKGPAGQDLMQYMSEQWNRSVTDILTGVDTSVETLRGRLQGLKTVYDRLKYVTELGEKAQTRLATLTKGDS